MRCAWPQMQLSALARREYAVRRTCTQAPHSCIHTARLRSGAGPLPVSPSTPEHLRPPSVPLTVVAHVTGPDRRLLGLYETRFGSIGTFSSRAFQRYYPRVGQPPSWLPTFESGVQNHVCPPFLTATLCPDRGTAEPSCTPSHVPRAAQAPVHRMPHPPSPGGASSPPRARAYPCATLLPSRGRCTRYRSGPATSGVL